MQASNRQSAPRASVFYIGSALFLGAGMISLAGIAANADQPLTRICHNDCTGNSNNHKRCSGNTGCIVSPLCFSCYCTYSPTSQTFTCTEV